MIRYGKKIKISSNKNEEERLRQRLEEIDSQLLDELVCIPELEFGVYLLIQEEIERALKLSNR